MIIDRKYIINRIEEILKERDNKKNFKKKNNFLKNIYQNSPRTLKRLYMSIRSLNKTRSILNKNYLFIEDDSIYKRWSLDFLIYCLKNNIYLDTDLFDKKDEGEILQFIDNKIRMSIFSLIEKNRLINDYKKLEKVYKNYLDNLSISREKIKYNKKEYFYNKSKIEETLFYHKLGLNFLSKKVLESIKEKTVIDCGAYYGDSCIILKDLKPKKIIAFEPDRNNFEELKKIVEKNNLPVECLNKGVGENNENISFSSGQGGGSTIPKFGKDVIEVIKLDNLDKENIKFIKMDIEGFELEAIKGAEQIIRKNKPVMLICLYHTGKDFFEIPNLLRKWVPNYKFRFLNLNKVHPIGDRVLLGWV
ncbi:MAG: FkbM family methyltransferase [Candidatus Absconditabacterales bacterium]|nr:FkbM family methyltransferase [Candidatus Absconditabacterales bacterium]